MAMRAGLENSSISWQPQSMNQDFCSPSIQRRKETNLLTLIEDIHNTELCHSADRWQEQKYRCDIYETSRNQAEAGR